jgi:predicted NAD-dependent protein-ADP-ribosyltransferase YbiA (DUF1768 family)
MTKAITFFAGEYAFLSMFYPSPIVFRNITFPTIQHAIVATMTENMVEQVKISQLPTPACALEYGKNIKPWSGWTKDYKIAVMKNFIDQKFDPKRNPDLVRRFLNTGNVRFINTNLLGDQFFGVVNGRGNNHKGRLLKQKREELQR